MTPSTPSPVPHLDSGDDWEAIAEGYRRKVSAFLEKTCLPGLEEAVVSQRMVTPPHFRHRLAVGQGRGLRPGTRADAKRLVPAS